MLTDLDAEKYIGHRVIVWLNDEDFSLLLGYLEHVGDETFVVEWRPDANSYRDTRVHRYEFDRSMVDRVDAFDAQWRSCPSCQAGPGEKCSTYKGNDAQQPHSGRRPPFSWYADTFVLPG